jgi:hypothetical protein
MTALRTAIENKMDWIRSNREAGDNALRNFVARPERKTTEA